MQTPPAGTDDRSHPLSGLSDHPSILLVEDEVSVREPLATYLRDNGFVVSEARNAVEAKAILDGRAFDVIILDVRLPGESGLDFFRFVSRDHPAPVIFLTALGSDVDRIIGLELGADDYVTKPFNPRELLARIRAVLRRANVRPPAPQETSSQSWAFGEWVLKFDQQILEYVGGAEVGLTSSEFALISAMAKRPRIPLSRDFLLDQIFGREVGSFDRSIDNAIARLRKKMEKHAPSHIKTVWARGYMLNADVRKT